MNEIVQKEIICGKCNLALKSAKSELWYQRETVSADFLKCPQCGQIYIPEKLAKGKIHEVEMALEEK